MRSAALGTLLAFLAVALWLLWNYEGDHTGIRAPWTGATFVASAAAFVAVGYFGRGLPALLIAAAAAVTGIVLVDPLIWHSSSAIELDPPWTPEDCDPGCISTQAAATAAAIAAALLAALGMLLRRVLSGAGTYISRYGHSR
jgi:hypothetical protein